ncbi:uncharacterized protein K460DRAFT_407648 [Cucurbitaria berberidis CBS 394.84]|uniref:HTH psq-type domain-containing protein n=1 Tax=Cucurbitaria berberidis CBS 394.84 TaxID=1168544 RepID=A0A9P4GD14_9PLEO|nr:uncharacterized protein K460DRAFT_407648 [Cucurbitaria berberidis CBS 394.84]KAF1843286.1 hypothetical protein K460DRAFT_407648 [Cucurbitaria berberidis CBS 394.84]
MNADQNPVPNVADSRWRSKKRKSLTVADRNQIYQFHEDNPLVTHGSIAAIFGVERSTVSKIVQKSYHGPQPTVAMSGHASRVEIKLLEWTHDCRKKGIKVTRDMIRTQATVLANPALSESIQPLPSTSPPQTHLPTSMSSLRPSDTLDPFLGQVSTAESHLSNLDLGLLSRTCALTTVQEDEPSCAASDSIGPFCQTIQNDLPHNILDQSSMYDPVLSLDTMPSSPQTYDSCAYPSSTYAEVYDTTVGGFFGDERIGPALFESCEGLFI